MLLFSYGTLQPGETRWEAIEDYVKSTRPQTLTGYWQIKHHPNNFPGLFPTKNKHTIPGTIIEFHPEHEKQAWYDIDSIEGVAKTPETSFYWPTPVQLDDGTVATVYFTNPVTEKQFKQNR